MTADPFAEATARAMLDAAAARSGDCLAMVAGDRRITFARFRQRVATLARGWNIGEVLRMTPADRVLHALPAAGTWGGVNIPLTAWSHGACLVLMDVWDPLRALSLIERERCTVWNAVDAMVKSLLACPDLDRYDRSSLRTGGLGSTGGGAHGLFEAFVQRIGVRHGYEPYGGWCTPKPATSARPARRASYSSGARG